VWRTALSSIVDFEEGVAAPAKCPGNGTAMKPAHRLHGHTLRPLLVVTHDQVFHLNRNGTVTYVCNCYGLTEDQVFEAGDTATDIEMLRIYPRAICVRSFDDELHGLLEIAHTDAVSQDLARCVREGIDHFFSSRAVPE
jgi:hypothetical protein